MERPGPALIGSFLVHGGIVALVLGIGMFAPKAAPRPIANAVPVSIVSDAVMVGMSRAVGDMRRAMARARGRR